MKGGNHVVVISDISAYSLEGLHSEFVMSPPSYFEENQIVREGGLLK